VEAGRTEGEAGEQAFLLSVAGAGEIPGLGRCGARGSRQRSLGTRAASGLRPGALDDAAFRRDRLQAATGKLRERLAQLKYQEENARRQVVYDKAKAVRDELAKELADVYPAFAQKLAELLPRIVANDREIEYINCHALPRGADRLLVAELKARGLPGWVVNGLQTHSITGQLYLPSWYPHTHSLWPPRK
jgi:hypothetical protein